jgi:putative ABC transport system permease protein
MTLIDIAFRNLVRRKSKSFFILAGLVIGVATVVALFSFGDAVTQDINHKLEKYGANILIVPKTESLSLSYGGLSLGGFSFEMQEIREADMAGIRSIKNAQNIAALGPMVLGVVEAGNRQVLLAGVDFDATTLLKPWWKIRGAFPEEKGLVLGSEAARLLSVEPGGTLLINGTEHPVSGVLNTTGSQDDQLVFARLKTAQHLLGKEGRISMAEVAALCRDCPIEDMVGQISSVLPGAKVMAIQQVVKGRMETLAQFRKFSYGISGVVVLIGSLVVLVTLMGSVRERTEEIGIFRAIGFRKQHVMRIILVEALFLSFVSGILGYGIGLGGSNGAFRMFSESGAWILPDVPMAAGSLLLAVLVGIVSSAYPALMASRMDPNEALKTI